ncbi:hypothetical protein [Botrimarina colliarenosi]|uniref:hypothetical protein n=1 Tax=Botrimarina colliarenosi TaxID=2528001 RepID=UPI0011B78468|nr:hypothetical protein [Botrimarina colliarenosi]
MRIALAGGLYPVVVFALWILITTALSLVALLGLGQGQPLLGCLAGAAAVLLASPAQFGIGFLWTGVVALVTLPLLFVVTTLCVERHAARDSIGRLGGSLVAAVATLPIGLLIAVNFTNWDALIVAVLGQLHVALAIAMGQVAGSLAGVADLRRRYHGRHNKSPVQFSIWQLLAVTVPLSALLAFLQLTDLLTPTMAMALFGAAFCAVLTWPPSTWLVNHWLDRRLRRRRAARLAERST